MLVGEPSSGPSPPYPGQARFGFSNLSAQVIPNVVVESELGFSSTAIADGQGVIRAIVRIAATITPTFTASTLLQAGVRLRDRLGAMYAAGLVDTATFQAATSAISNLAVMAQLRVLDSVIPGAIAGLSLQEQVRVLDQLSAFLGVALDETVSIGDQTLADRRLVQVVGDLIDLSDVTDAVLMLRLDAAATIELTDAQAMQAIFALDLADTISLDALFASPNFFTTWAINTRVGAVTEYQNYRFNSFARLGHRYLGANESGLYELVGDDDEGDPIVARLRSGKVQMNAARFTGLKGVYLGIRGQGEFFLRLIAGGGETRTYRLLARDMETTKINIGKGLRHRYLAFELESTGQDFDLDTIEFVPILAQRRV